MELDEMQYTFVVQIKEIINVNASRIIATVRIDNEDNDFMDALERLQQNREYIKQIDIGSFDLATAPIMEPSDEA